mmetsp:Transcript_60865/g.73129  ORF Transcript_60865/g.73129 Transcript_60865/m.73129 type:complete len:274 (-) Transcript_60865:330-1151(-)
MIAFRYHRVSLAALQRTSLPSLSYRAKSDDLQSYGNVYRLAIQIPNYIGSIPEETQIILRSKKIGFVQGGTIDDVRKRVSTLQTGTPFPLKLERAFRCPTPNLYEKYFHKLFKSRRGKGEWFDLSEQDECEMDDVMENLYHTGNFIGDTSLLKNIQLEKGKKGNGRKVDLFDQVNSILHGHRLDLQENSNVSSRRYLSRKDKIAVIVALKKHPEASEKIGCGVDSIFVKEVFYHGISSYCFHVQRIDGSEEDFSYHSCFSRDRSNFGYTHVGP